MRGIYYSVMRKKEIPFCIRL